MSPIITRYVAGRSYGDQPLTQAARVALEASQTPRFIKMIVDHDGKPIEKPEPELVQNLLEEPNHGIRECGDQ